jgi:hypothetical protein
MALTVCVSLALFASVMTSKVIVPRLVDHLWYPILVKAGGGHVIRELQGKSVNDWNDMVRKQNELHTSNNKRILGR